MRIPDYDEALGIAALVLEVERDEIEPMVRAELLHLALLRPMACKGGAPLHRTDGEVARCLFVECALSRALPRRQVRFGWLMTKRAIELSGYKWRQRAGDADQLRKFGEQLEMGIDPGRPLVVWLEARIKPHSPKQDADASVVHIAGPMTPPPEENLGEWELAVSDGLNRFLEDSKAPGAATTCRPNLYPVRGHSEEETGKLIEERLHTADGLVVLAPEASWGAAIELEVGLRGQIPTLFLHPAGRAPGKRARSRLDATEATVREFDDDPDDPETTMRAISELVYGWLEDSYGEIVAMQHRRSSVRARLARFLAAIQTKQTQMGKVEERKALAAAGIAEGRARILIEDEWQLQHASLTEVIALSNAYQVPANIDGSEPEPTADRPAHLMGVELRWLATVAKEDSIPATEVIELISEAQREVVRPGRRRKLYTGVQPWRLLRSRKRRKP
jgi:hypothetical protein